MPLLRDSTFLRSAEFVGDKFIFNHMQDTAPTMEQAQYERDLSNNGWTEDRSMRKIASIPEIELVKHPEFLHDQKALLTWLKGEGRKYATVTKGY
jgi:hypothetical protein